MVRLGPETMENSIENPARTAPRARPALRPLSSAAAVIVASIAIGHFGFGDFGYAPANRSDQATVSEPADATDYESGIERAKDILHDDWNVPYDTAEVIVRSSLQAAARHDLPASLLLGIMATESGFRTTAHNSYGAVGLMQVVASVHRDKITEGPPREALKNPRTNIRVGAQVLADCLRSARGNLERALARYSGNTRNYARKVERYQREFEEALGDADRGGWDVARLDVAER